ncbi:ATP-binding cassette domain-containing protein [Corynebacterium sp. LK2590]|uniref:ATP-binding cassette domain-containing protein n=1 Tax=unclassified Corynebacterium TaxID=2624378 RepID=UPI0034D0013B
MELAQLADRVRESSARLVQVVVPYSYQVEDVAEALAGALETRAVLGADPQVHISALRNTVIEELAIPLEHAGWTRESMECRCTAVLAQVGLSEHAERDPRQLSGGQTRRLAIGALTIVSPAAVVLTEPLAGLDSRSRAGIVELLHALDGSRVVTISHAVEEDLGGEVVALAATTDEPDLAAGVQALDLPGAGTRIEPAAGSVADAAGESLPVRDLVVRRGAGRRRWWQFRQTQGPGFKVGPVDFDLVPGRVLWVRGDNGSGKTTLVRALAGLDGHEPVCDSVAACLQSPFDQVAAPTVETMLGSAQACRQLGLDPQTHPLDLPVSQLRVAQVVATARRAARVVVFDEPDTYLAPAHREVIAGLIARVAATGAAVVLTCHNEKFVHDLPAGLAVHELWLGRTGKDLS